jgi:hypothetical protein
MFRRFWKQLARLLWWAQLVGYGLYVAAWGAYYLLKLIL